MMGRRYITEQGCAINVDVDTWAILLQDRCERDYHSSGFAWQCVLERNNESVEVKIMLGCGQKRKDWKG